MPPSYRLPFKPRNGPAVLTRAGDGLDANAVPFPFAQKILGIERAEIALLERMGEHRRPERGGVAARRLVAAAFQPGEQVEIGRGEAWPDQLELVRVLIPKGCGRGLGKPRRDADPHRAGEEL